jgi:hypothetical protein
MRRIVANLLCEDDLAHLLHAGDPRRRHQRPPTQSTLRTVARMGALLAAFAREGDHLWIPAPESEPLRDLEPAEEVLAWCETPEVAALRTAPRPASVSWDAPLWELLWQLPVAPPSVVATVHHRAFHLNLAEDLGCALPGARMVESLADLDRTLAARDAPPAWVVKAPLSASGRARHIERKGGPLADPKARRTVERLFEHHGPLLFEPWLDRLADFGCAALLTETELKIVSLHGQRVDAKGQFAGIDLDAKLPPRDQERLEEVVQATGQALRRVGYTGPFGLDAWHYRRPDGSVVFHPLGEINARMTFGLVMRALAERGARQS